MGDHPLTCFLLPGHFLATFFCVAWTTQLSDAPQRHLLDARRLVRGRDVKEICFRVKGHEPLLPLQAK